MIKHNTKYYNNLISKIINIRKIIKQFFSLTNILKLKIFEFINLFLFL